MRSSHKEQEHIILTFVIVLLTCQNMTLPLELKTNERLKWPVVFQSVQIFIYMCKQKRGLQIRYSGKAYK